MNPTFRPTVGWFDHRWFGGASWAQARKTTLQEALAEGVEPTASFRCCRHHHRRATALLPTFNWAELVLLCKHPCFALWVGRKPPECERR